MSESPSEQGQPRSKLIPNQLNVVGESHDESGQRREAEQKFCQAMTGLAKYWTESEFPELQRPIGSRKIRPEAANRTPEADMMEFRATHSAALVIAGFERLARAAHSTAAVPPDQAKAAVGSFIRDDLAEFKELQERLKRSWRKTASPTVNDLVQEVYDTTGMVAQEYQRGLGSEPAKMLQATQVLADHDTTFRGFVSKLEHVIGQGYSEDGTAASLAFKMRVARSTFMGLAAEASSELGVWKVGDLHVTDLLNRTARIQIRRMNLVSKKDFNDEFDVWMKS